MRKPKETQLLLFASIAALLLIAVGALFCFAPIWQPGAPSPRAALPASIAAVSEPAEPGPLNVNTATARELMALPGVGEVRAAAIVAWREEHGPFAALEEVAAVDGISSRMIESWQGLAVAGPEE